MTPQEHARDLMLRLSAIRSDGPDDIPNLLVRSFERVLKEEREACAAIVEQAARALISGRRRTNQGDRHTAEVLMDKARKIRARAPDGQSTPPK